MTEKYKQTTIRLPHELYDAIEELASLNIRSVRAEIEFAIRKHLAERKPDANALHQPCRSSAQSD